MSNRLSRFSFTVQPVVSILLLAAGIAAWQGGWRNQQPVHAAAGTVLRLTTSRKLSANYRGAELAVRALNSGKAAPLSLASDDFDVDGVDDLAAGYATPGGGLIAFHRGNLDAFAPQSQASFEAFARGEYPSPYLPDVDVVEIPEQPDFLAAGDVIGINGPGIVAAARGGNRIYVLARGPSGKMELLESLAVPGAITALDAHLLKPAKYWHVVAGIRGGNGSGLLVCTGSPEGLRAEAIFPLNGDADSFAFGNLDTDSQTDVLVLAAGKLSILHNASQRLEPVDVSYSVAAATLGRFLFDRSSMVQMALLGSDGRLHIVARDAIDSRPVTAADLAGRSRLEALRPKADKVEPLAEQAVPWKEVESYPGAATVDRARLHMFKTRISNNANDDVMMFGASRVSVLAHPDERPLTGDLLERSDLAADSVAALAHRLSVHVGPGVVYLQRGELQPRVILATGATLNVSRFDDPVPTSPISNACTTGNSCSLREAIQRANADNAGDTIMLPSGTYTLTRGKIYHNYDGNQGTLEARASMSIVGAGQGSTIIQAGASSASTCVSAYPPPNPIPLLTSANYEVFTSFASPSACTSVDKIFSFNQDIPDTAHTLPGGTAFCTVDANGHPNNAPTIFPVDPNGAAVSTTTSGNNVSFLGLTVSSVCVSAVLSNGTFTVSNLTLENGFNRGNVAGDADGYGGALDFDTGSAGTATLTLMSVTLQNNTASQGGGATFFNFTTPIASNSPTVIVSNSIVQNNIANWADPYHDMHELGGFLGSGGGLLADVKTRMQMTNTQVLGNTAIQIADARSGTNTINTDPSSVGGLELIGQLNSGARNGIHNSIISGNKSTLQAGGIYSAAPLVIDTGTVISGNQAVLDGAGVFLTQSTGETATISNSTIVNNALVSCSSLNSASDPFLGGTFCNELPAGDLVPRGGGGIKVSNQSGGLTLSFSRIFGNNANGGGGDALANIASTATATNNWWGTNTSSPIAGEISTTSGGTTTFDPFIVLANTPNPVKIKQGATSQVTASVLQDNHGSAYTPANIGVLVGLPASGSIFAASGGIGTFTPANNNIQSSGTAGGSFTATAVGLETVTATLDNATADAIIHVLAPPSIAKGFAPVVIPADGTTTSTLKFTITNPNQLDGINGLAFTDTFASAGGVKVAPTPAVVNNCGGTFTATAGSTTVSLSGGTMNQNTTCTVSVKVVGTTDGIQNDTSSTVTATDAGGLTSTGTASASLTVINPPHISKAFGAATIPFGATTSLTFTINNPNTTLSLDGISFTDNLPTEAPGTLIVANPSALNNACGGTATATAGASTVALSGVTLAHGASCTLSVNVQGTAVGAASNSVTASDTLAGAGNTSTAPFTVVKADTGTAVTSSVNPSVFGQSVTFTATVSAVAPGAGTPTGTLTFLDGGSPIGTGTLNNGVATLNSTALAVGNHTVTTSYGGDTHFNGSTGSLTGNPQVVNKAGTSTSLASGVNPSVFGQSVTFTATVSPVAPGAGTPAGTVTFLDGGNSIGTGTIGSGGVATFSTTALSIGNHTITVTYAGDGNFLTSTGSLTGNPQVVNKANSSIAMVSSVNPSTLGQNVTFTATVSAAAPGSGTPSGTVTFLDAGNSIGTGTLAGGVATFSTTSLAVGSHTITATYTGDTNFNSSTGPLTGNPQVVNKLNTITSVTSSANPSVFGQSVTFTATISPATSSTLAPTGTVTFLDGGSPIGTGTLSGGVATFSTSALAGGSNSITIGYNGDGNFNGSTGSLTGNPQVVNKANTTTSATSSVNPSVFGQPVMLTATVSPVAPGAGTPGGTVTFLDGANPIGTGTLSGGVASLNTTALAVGNHTITTTYSGDGNSNGSTGSLTGNPQVVNKANTATAVTSSLNPSSLGQSVTFTATVTAVAPGAGTPGGTVTFLDGGNSIGTGTLSGGKATLTTSALAVGNHTLTTSYGGDNSFNGGTGSLTGNPQVVNKAGSSITVTSSLNSAPLGQSVTFTATVAAVAPATGTPTGTVTFLDGSNSLGSGTLNNGVATFSTSSLAAGNHTITATYPGDNSFNGSTGSLTGNPQVIVAPPGISKTFGAGNVIVGGTTTLTLTLANPSVNTVAETGVAVSDTFPAGIAVAATPGLSNTCGGTASNGTASVSLVNGSIPVNGTCTVKINVTLTSAGLKTNTTGVVSSTNGGTGSTASAQISAATPPTIAKAFGAATIAFGGSTSLTFAIANPNTTIGLTGVAFSDTLPAGLVLSSPQNASSTCGGTLTAAAGGGVISLTGASLAAGGSCAIGVNVTGTSLGAKQNITGVITATESGPGTTSNAATLTVTQVPTTSMVTVTPGSVQYSDQVTLTATLSPASALNESPATGVAFVLQNSAGTTNLGSASLVVSGTSLTGSLMVGVPVAAGSYTVIAQFTGVDANFAVSNPTNSLTVTKEDVTVTPLSSNPLAVQVTSPGSNASQAFTLGAVLQEPADGSLGAITKAVPVTCTLSPVISGTQAPAPFTATSGTLNTGATPNTLTVSCPFSGVPVNVYDVIISVGGNFYTGSTDTVVGVFDPSLGNVTGSGSLLLPDGNRATFGLQGKFNKGGQVQGGLMFIEHLPGGNNVVVKSNSLGTMSIVGNTAVLIGKATDNGVGNYAFQATGVDNNASGGTDQFGLQVTAPDGTTAINFAPIDIAGGNIQVPQATKRTN